MLYAKNLIDSTSLKVKLPQVIDIKGAIDMLITTTGAAEDEENVKPNFLRKLKEEGILKIEWIPGWENLADMFTKNTGVANFKRHKEAKVVCYKVSTGY